MTGESIAIERTSESAAPDRVASTQASVLVQSAPQGQRIQIIIYGDSATLLRDVVTAAGQQPAVANLRSVIDECKAESDMIFADRVAQWSHEHDALLIVSDRFVPAGEIGDQNNLARLLRERTSAGKAIIALLALVEPPLRRIGLVDSIVARGAGPDALAAALQRALSAIRYKIPPMQRSPVDAEVVEVGPVNDFGEFKACLALRYAVYKLLGYFHEDPDDEPSGLELNYYDPSALHFIALARSGTATDVAGTARLIVTNTKMRRGGLFGDTDRIRRRYGSLSDQIAAKSSLLRKELDNGPGSAALPVFAAFDYDEFAQGRSIPVANFCELSRVVVADKYRGLGVSRLLIRACIAAALELRQRYMVLECIPQHAVLYAKYGFEKISDSKHQRAWGIDQLATVMGLGLDDLPTNPAVQFAKRDVAMMQIAGPGRKPPAGLCLCRNATCWERGEYGNRGRRECPLKTRFIH